MTAVAVSAAHAVGGMKRDEGWGQRERERETGALVDADVDVTDGRTVGYSSWSQCDEVDCIRHTSITSAYWWL